MTRTRRSVLAALGTSVVSAGCLSAPSSGGAEDDGAPASVGTTTPSPSAPAAPTTAAGRPRRVPMGRTVTRDGTRLAVTNPRVRKAVASRGPAHTHLVADAGQYVVVDVTVDGEPPGPYANLDLRSAVDGRTLPGSDPLPTTTDRGYAFSFPTARHGTAAVRWLADTRDADGGAADGRDVDWELPDSTREALALEPRFSVTDLRVPRRDGQFVLEMTVANDGDRDGRFAARISLESFSGGHVVEFPVTAGGSETYAGRPGDILLYLENQGGGVLTVQYPDGDGLRTVERTVGGTGTATATDG